jgi:hypothetical protein
MRVQNSAYTPEGSMFPFEGVDYLAPSTQVNPSLSPELNNVDVELGHLSKRKGYSDLGGSVDGTVLALIDFKDLSGTVHYVCITTTKEYELVSGSWTERTFQTTAPATVNRTGTEADGIDWVIITGLDSTGTIVKWLIITNGVDAPRYWDGSTSKFKKFSTDSVANNGAALDYTGFVTCKTLSSIDGYLVLGNVTTSASEPTVVVWGDTTSLTTFLPGNAGAVDLVDVIGEIQKILPLGDRLMIYGEDSIHQMIHIGANDIFSFQKIISTTRLLGPRAIVDVGPFHFFMSQENIYLFDGTRGVRRIGDRISRRYREILQSDQRTLAFAFLDQPKNSIFFVLPTSSTSAVVFKLEFNIFDISLARWTVHTYNDRVTAMGFFTADSALAWNSASITNLTWAQAAGLWNQGSTNQGFPKRILGHSTKVSVADNTVLDDDAVAVDASWESLDFTVPREFLSEFGRWIEIEFEARGTSLDVSLSTDKGSTFVLSSSVTLDGAWTRYRVFIDEVSPTLRVKLSSSAVSVDWEVRWLRLWFTYSGAD